MADSYSSTEDPGTRATPGSPSPADDAAPKGRFRLWALLVGHSLVTPLFSTWAASEGGVLLVREFLLYIPLFGFVFAQATLLAFWTAFSSAVWWLRLIGLVLGIVYLEPMFQIGTRDDELTLMPFMVSIGTTAVFGLTRWRSADVCRFRQKAAPTSWEGFRFSVRGLMLLTLVVAAFIVGIREMRENGFGEVSFFALAIWSLCFTVTGLAAVWAALGLFGVMLRSAVALVIAGAVGALFGYTIGANAEGYIYVISMMLCQAIVLLASLLVVRSCGYRLVRKSASDAG